MSKSISPTPSVRARIETTLFEALKPARLEVIDESHHHAGHQPNITGTGETHMRVRVVSERFAGVGRVERHRIVNALLKPELDAGLHALAIEAAAPGETTRW
ncbi:BolA family protein [Rhizobium straminoryzae]|uniref:BolA family transcriptional regulator n=1 Tax=Rhizobium straminoryzae TaxID=1387186 RepID=A0A549SZR0_9HYPH|nr:BolA family protein [Rhizobium straminoryzae]TRL35122.1 BolA family transcriptional regulator [Rhizobium straminoryzae]